MTPRERTLGVIFGGLLLLAGVGSAYYFLYHVPMANLERAIVEAEKSLDKKQGEYFREQAKNNKFAEISPRLEKWRVLSLPEANGTDPHLVHTFQDQLQVDYRKFLDGVMRRSGFTGANFTITPKPILRKQAAPVAAAGPARPTVAKGPPYTALGYTVTITNGTYKEILQALETLYRSPILHEIRGLSIEKPEVQRGSTTPANALKATLNLEVLQVQGAEKLDGKTRTTILPEPSKIADFAILAQAGRNYQQELLKNDMFLGKPPPPPKKIVAEPLTERPLLVEAPKMEEPKEVVVEKPKEPVRDVLGVVKLVQITDNGRRWEAFFYNQATGLERLLTLGIRRDMEFSDRHENVMLKGEVVNISTTRGIYFRSEGKYYCWGLGEFLDQSLSRPIAVVAEGKRAVLLKELDTVEGYALMSVGDVGQPHPPKPALSYGFGVGLAGFAPSGPPQASKTVLGGLTGSRDPRTPRDRSSPPMTKVERLTEEPIGVTKVERLTEEPVEVAKDPEDEPR